ncbi:MAG: CDP-alcohol phosphatidyltransferase family protein [Halioglobus sp.]
MLRYLPNALTVSRMLIAVPLGFFILHKQFEIAFFLGVSAGLSDLLDGYFARRLNAFSRWGAALDPIADKTLVLIMFTSMSAISLVPWTLTAIIVARDIIIILGASYYYKFIGPYEFGSRPLSKANMAFQIAFCALILLAQVVDWVPATVIWIAMALLIGTAVASVLDYAQFWTREGLKTRRNNLSTRRKKRLKKVPSTPVKKELNILTYNIHKGYCSGNRRFVLDSMRQRIAESGADIVFLQEIAGRAEKSEAKKRKFSYPDQPHFEYLAEEAWPHYAYGRNAIYRKGDHGNAILSMYPFTSWENIDISKFPRSSRSILHGVIELPDHQTRLHTLCVHMGLLEQERREQLQALTDRINEHVPPNEPIIIAGDFNDWRQRAELHLHDDLGLSELFVELEGRHARTFPVWAPILPVDRIYYRGLKPVRAQCLNDGHWRDLSDHAALFGVFSL